MAKTLGDPDDVRLPDRPQLIISRYAVSGRVGRSLRKAGLPSVPPHALREVSA